MQHCTICECDSNLTNINLGPISFDERLPLVDHILGQMILDRYGAYAFVRRIRSTPSARDAVSIEVNMDLSPQPYPIPIGRRIFSGVSFSVPRRDGAASITSYLKRMTDLASHTFGPISNTSPTTLGRGSPKVTSIRQCDSNRLRKTAPEERSVYRNESMKQCKPTRGDTLAKQIEKMPLLWSFDPSGTIRATNISLLWS